MKIAGLLLGLLTVGVVWAETGPTETFRSYCYQCHSKGPGMAGVNLVQLTAESSIAAKYKQWEKVAAALEQNRMPPKGLSQPSDAERLHAVSWIRGELGAYAKSHEGDPGRVTVRRLTSGEYAYSIQDLTGLDLNLEHEIAGDEVGGEGFTNYGDVQFMQDASMERYLEAAKKIANYAVIGAGPLTFFTDPGKTGFELAAVSRISAIYRDNGFRTVSGEGGLPYGLDHYRKALYVAWQYKHRAALGQPAVTLRELAAREKITTRFAQHFWSVMNTAGLGYPSSEIVARWRALPGPSRTMDAKAARAQCDEIQKYMVTWPSWMFGRGDAAVGGAGDERPLVFNDESLKVEERHHFTFVRGGRGVGKAKPIPAGGTARIYLNAVLANPDRAAIPNVMWRNATIAFTTIADRKTGLAKAARLPLRSVLTEESAGRLGDGDFASNGSIAFDVRVPEGATLYSLQVDAEIGKDRAQVLRITISDREDGGSEGIPVWGLVGDPQSKGYGTWKAGVLQYAHLLPPNSHGEATPADKDPAPEPFDSRFNTPEHDEFLQRVKYVRDDRFVVEKILDDATRGKLDQAWNDVYAAFEYHDAYVRLLAKKLGLDLKGKGIADLDLTAIEALPAEPRKYILPLRVDWEKAMAAQLAARPGHVEDCLRFASRAWRRPLTEGERQSLRAFYAAALKSERDHGKAIRALLARILVAPAFLYRMEPATLQRTTVRQLSNWEMASRLSYFLWSSIPDEELRRAAAAGELNDETRLRAQVKRMLLDVKARRLSTEFFGQWLGFYRFDQFRGVDTTRYPEFTDEVKSSMYEEAVSFFDYVVRKDRPVREILHADYTFLNQPLAKHYGVKKEVASKDELVKVDGANEFGRGGLLRLGAVLTVTSAPLRTSPVKRGDWVLRRVLGTPVPPPPADAGSIPADEKSFGGLSVREKLAMHKRNATCAGCHTRIDPLGFPLEKYDSVGRLRDKYSDGKPIDDSSETADKTQIAGVDGLVKYLDGRQEQVTRTLAQKLLGYALGRTVQLSDEPLIARLASSGGDATFADLAARIVVSKQFRNRQEQDARPQTATLRGTR
ncbi:MAG: DUF1592 domain-containing protein [Bryobacteraceae bacterium]